MNLLNWKSSKDLQSASDNLLNSKENPADKTSTLMNFLSPIILIKNIFIQSKFPDGDVITKMFSLSRNAYWLVRQFQSARPRFDDFCYRFWKIRRHKGEPKRKNAIFGFTSRKLPHGGFRRIANKGNIRNGNGFMDEGQWTSVRGCHFCFREC